MMRSALFAVWLILPVATAAPVPKAVLTPEQEAEFDRLWDAVGRSGVGQIDLYCRLVSEPAAATEYLTRHFPPVELSQTEAKRLLEQLASEDEKEWRRAYRDLLVRDVRLALGLSEAWKLTTHQQRFRFGAVLRGHGSPNEIPPYVERFGLGLTQTGNGGQGYWQIGIFSKPPRPICSSTLFPTYDESAKWWRKYNDSIHRRAVVAVAALERFGTPAARKHLVALTKGHPEASATVEAIAALERLKNPPKADLKPLAEVWADSHVFATVSTANRNLNRPEEAVRFFSTTLKPLVLNKADGQKLLARLFSDDPKQARTALREAQTYDLRLASSVNDLWEQAKTSTHRGRLVEALSYYHKLHEQVIGDGYNMDAPHAHLDYTYQTSNEDPEEWVIVIGKRDGVADVSLTNDDKQWLREQSLSLPATLAGVTWDRWPREGSAIYILDAIGTDDAIAIIKDMATGHPDAGPTKAAKGVLKRRGIK